MAGLDNRAALIIGAARGIGRAIGLALAHRVADAAVNDRSPAGERGAADVAGLGRRALRVPALVVVTFAPPWAAARGRVCASFR